MVAQEFSQLFSVVRVLVDAKLDILTKLLKELLVILSVLTYLLEQLQAFLCNVLLYHLQNLVVLQVLPRNVQRQILRINHSTNEAQVFWDQFFTVVHDEHSAHVELDVVLLLLCLEHVERSSSGNEDDGFEFERALNREQFVCKLVFPVVGD